VEFNEDKVRKITSEIFIALGRLEDLQIYRILFSF